MAKTQPKVDSKRVAAALGAEPVGDRSLRPLDIIDVRERLQRQVGQDPWLDEPWTPEEQAVIDEGEKGEAEDW